MVEIQRSKTKLCVWPSPAVKKIERLDRTFVFIFCAGLLHKSTREICFFKKHSPILDYQVFIYGFVRAARQALLGHDWTVQPCNHAPCNHAIMQPCNHAAMQPCSHATMQSCNHAIMQPCNHATMQPCNHAAMQPCNHATMQPCNHATMQPRNHATMQPCSHAAMQSCNHATMHLHSSGAFVLVIE